MYLTPSTLTYSTRQGPLTVPIRDPVFNGRRSHSASQAQCPRISSKNQVNGTASTKHSKPSIAINQAQPTDRPNRKATNVTESTKRTSAASLQAISQRQSTSQDRPTNQAQETVKMHKQPRDRSGRESSQTKFSFRCKGQGLPAEEKT